MAGPRVGKRATQGYGLGTSERSRPCPRGCRTGLGRGDARMSWQTGVLRARARRDAPVVLVHGWGGSFRTTWRQSGFTELLADAGRTVIGVDLLGHGAAPKPHDPADVRRPDDAHRRRAARRAGRRRRVLARGDHAAAPRHAGSPSASGARPRRHRAQRVRARRRARPSGSSPASRAPATPTTTWPACSPSTPTSPATTAVALAAVMRRPDEGPFTAEDAAGGHVPGARRHRRPRLRRSGRPARRGAARRPSGRRCATSTTSPRPSRSASSTPRSSSSTPSLADAARSRPTSALAARPARRPAGSWPSRPRRCTASPPTPTTPAAVARIFAVKGRPADHPLIVHLLPDCSPTLGGRRSRRRPPCWPRRAGRDR